jgi:tetrahydromethanopterin S-methyltransferase subunit G
MDLNSINAKFQSMDERFTEIEEKIDEMRTKLNQVVDALLGNPLTNSGGFKHEMETINQRISYLEKKQREFDEFRKRFYWTVGIVVATGLLFEFIVNLYSKVK